VTSPLGASSRVDRHSHVPVYAQLKGIIREAIDSGSLGANERIPSENELATEYNVSRMTVRQAIRELARDGYVYVRKGDGTFVGGGARAQMLVKLDGFSTEMTKRGHTVRSRVLRAERVTSGGAHAQAFAGLGERPDSSLVMIERIRYLDEEPFALERSYLSAHTGERLLDRTFDETFSIYQFLSHERGISLSRAEHTIEPRLAEGETASALALAPGSPILFVRGTTFSVTGGPVEYIEGNYRGDRYTFTVVIAK
jgi:GntR family transcriptional regulator